MAGDPVGLSDGVPDGPKIFDLWRKRLSSEHPPEAVLSLIPRLREIFMRTVPSDNPSPPEDFPLLLTGG